MRTAKLFQNGRSQAVRLPKEFRFRGTEVYVSRDAETGSVVLSERPQTFEQLFELLDRHPIRPGVDLDRDRSPLPEREL